MTIDKPSLCFLDSSLAMISEASCKGQSDAHLTLKYRTSKRHQLGNQYIVYVEVLGDFLATEEELELSVL